MSRDRTTSRTTRTPRAKDTPPGRETHIVFQKDGGHPRAAEIVARANEYVGAPYKHQGRDMKLGIDCAGLLICVARDLKISQFNTADYAKRPDARTFRRHMIAAGCRSVPKYKNGDILRMASANHPVHSGIYERDENGVEWVIHAWAVARKVVRQHLTPEVKKDIREAMRFPE